MHTKQPTALKCDIKTIKSGVPIKENGKELVLIDGKKIGRINVIGTVMHKFENKERMFVFSNIDDGTGVISLRFFKENTKKMEGVLVGDMVNVIAGVREFEKNVYLSPISIKKVLNPNSWLLRKIELSKKEEVPETSKNQVLKVLKKFSDKGTSFDEIVEESGLAKEDVENIVSELLEKGVVFEPKPNTLKMLE
ncbi:MAG: hypothetical protein GOU97_02270 [Nanoarchaeota archaeon]|nr:hypothetical protein [Nanoarchaeota archaeon]